MLQFSFISLSAFGQALSIERTAAPFLAGRSMQSPCQGRASNSWHIGRLKRAIRRVARGNALSAPTGFASVANRCFGVRP
jgi:hypothetical protein